MDNTLEQMQNAELKEAWINKVKKQTDEDVSAVDIDKELEKMFRRSQLKQAQEMLSGGSFDPNKMMSLIMMKEMMGSKSNPDSALRAEVESLKNQINQQNLVNNFQAQINALKDNKGNSSNDLIIALEKIRTEAEKKNEDMKNQLMQREREFFSEKISDLKDSLGNSGSGFEKQIVDKIQNKILDKIDAGNVLGESEKSNSDVAKELIGNVMEKIKEPLLVPLGQGLRDRIARGGSFPGVPQQPQYAEPMPITPEQMAQYPPEVQQQMQEAQFNQTQPQNSNNSRNIQVVK